MASDTARPAEIDPADLEPHYDWGRAIPAPGHGGVDTEERVNFDRLRNYRLGRAKQALENSGLGALLCFDNNNIRYLTGTAIGEWSRDKMSRYALLMQGEEPHVWDFGSAASHHRIHAPWLRDENIHAGMLGLRGTVPPDAGLMTRAAEQIKSMLDEAGVGDMPIGVDICEPPMLFELQKRNIEVRDGQQVMLDAREVKNIDEIVLLNQAAGMVDAVYHMIGEELKPGVRERTTSSPAPTSCSTRWAPTTSRRSTRSRASAAARTRITSPTGWCAQGDQAFFDILHGYMGYRTCYYRTFNVGRASEVQEDAYKQCREWLDAAIELVRPGVSTDEIAAVWPEAEEFGFAGEMEAFGLQFGHGLGVSIHERPIISRLISMEDPKEIKEGMVFALETYCPAKDGYSAARIEEEVVVTDEGPRVISLYPAEDLPISAKY